MTTLRQVCFLQPSLPDRVLSPTGQVNLDEIQPFLLQRRIDHRSRGAHWKVVVAMRCYSEFASLPMPEEKLAVGVEYVDGGRCKLVRFTPRWLFYVHRPLSSTRILLNSTSRHHPHGIGNSTGILGKHVDLRHTFGVGVVGRRKGRVWPAE